MKKYMEMENILPPKPPEPGKGEPVPATEEDIKELAETHGLVKSIAGAAAQFRKKCEGQDSYTNNCAHFLSDAFIRAGYTELLPNNDCVNARCGTSAKRVIRAKDMHCWFKKMATKTNGGNALPKNDGFWAVFQFDENEYCCGHVVIIDTDNDKFYGTGNYPRWKQYAYKW